MRREFFAPAALVAGRELDFTERQYDIIRSQAVSSLGTAGSALACMVCLCWLHDVSRSSYFLLWLLGLTAVPMAILDLFVNKVHHRASTGLVATESQINWRRCFVKYLGFLATLLTLSIIYRVVPEYRKAFYQPCWQMLQIMALPLLPLAVVYIVWVDRRMVAPCDTYWHTGLVVLGRWQKVNWRVFRFHAAAWMVKGFFLPLMLAGGAHHLQALARRALDMHSFDAFYVTSLTLLLTFDVVFGAIGYLLTLRVLDAHVRSVEPTAVGWVAALCCYPPFAPLFQGAWLNYRGTVGWQECGPWSRNPVLYVSWGFAILMLHGIYVWSTCSFGCRFSNLTNRGIIVDGPYRYLKHPAYVSKNLAWWLMYVPFAAFGTWQEAVRACLLLGLTNCIYIARAWTEERHLRSDPEYLAYCKWMGEHGLVAQFRIMLRRAMKCFASRQKAFQP